ncbi:gem-associated protein 7, partial [Cyanistes caeruleus]|uniref:gem-associated protein 7 n=1 Tax=Cyanistes caeruleus TaxID=156563 RepID=UPI000CDB0DDB
RDNSRDNSRDSRGNSQDNSREDSREDPRDPGAEQRARAALRERFLRLLGSARGRRTRFSLWSGILVPAEFGAADPQTGALQVDSLQTPLGIQGSALLRSGDVLEFSFPLE